MQKLALIVLLALTALPAGLQAQEAATPSVTNFEECAQAGGAVSESFPRTCQLPDGRQFVEFPDWWDQLPPEAKQLVLAQSIEELQRATNGEGAADLESYGSGYPFTGIGISFGPRWRQEDQDAREAAIRVSTTWKGSPAEKAGILPADWLISVNGDSICSVTFLRQDTPEERESKEEALTACNQSAKRFIQEGGDTVTVEVERDGKRLNFAVGKAAIGQEAAAFLRQNLARWTAHLESQQTNVAALAKACGTVPDGELDACYGKSLALQAVVTEPWDEFWNFVNSLQNLPE